jgi:hypothetical protein
MHISWNTRPVREPFAARDRPPSATRTMSERRRQRSRRAGRKVCTGRAVGCRAADGLWGPPNQSIKMVQTLGGTPGGQCRRGLSSANGDLVTENDVLFGPGLALPSSSGYAVAGREDVWHQTRPSFVFSGCPPSLGRSAFRRPLLGCTQPLWNSLQKRQISARREKHNQRRSNTNRGGREPYNKGAVTLLGFALIGRIL